MKFVLLSFLIPVSLWSQNATVSGRVIDPSQAVIPQAAVEFTNLSTGVQTVTKTNSEGRYALPPLVPGNYKASCSSGGFATLLIEGVTLEVGQARTLDFSLQTGAVSESVNVSDQTPLLQGYKSRPQFSD